MPKHRKQKLAKFGDAPIATDSAPDNVQILPQSMAVLAGGFPVYEDVVKDLDANAYTLIRQCPAIYGPMDKIATIIGGMVWKVVGNKKEKKETGTVPVDEPSVDEKLELVEPETGGARQELLQEIIDNMYGLKAATRAMIWGFVEGVIFCKVNVGKSLDGLSDAFVLPDLRNNVRKKVNAGGRLRWYKDDATGKTYIVREQETNAHAPAELAQPAQLNPAEFIIFCPGATGNPEGDSDLAINLFKLARLYNKVMKNLDRYADRHGLPLELLMGDGRPSTLGSILATKVQALADRKPGENIGLNLKEKIELIEPKGTTATFLLDLKADLEADAARLILKSTLTSDTKQAGPAGSSQVHQGAEDHAAKAWGEQLADAFTEQLLTWIVEHNPDMPADDTTYHLELVEQEKDEEIAEDEKTGIVPVVPGVVPPAVHQPMPAAPVENK